jgi:hypothetical protein
MNCGYFDGISNKPYWPVTPKPFLMQEGPEPSERDPKDSLNTRHPFGQSQEQSLDKAIPVKLTKMTTRKKSKIQLIVAICSSVQVLFEIVSTA